MTAMFCSHAFNMEPIAWYKLGNSAILSNDLTLSKLIIIGVNFGPSNMDILR